MTHPREAPKKKKFTYGDYLEWPDDERWELIDGDAFDMSPSPTLEHQEILGELCTQFRTFLRGKPCRVFPELDIILPKKSETVEKATTVVRPDLVVVCDNEKMEGKHIQGAPDLAIEILSPGTGSYDFIKKRRLYEKVGVKEFWLVQPTERIVTVFQLETNGTFGKPEYYDETSKIAISVLPGLEIDLSLVFPPIKKVVRESPRTYRK